MEVDVEANLFRCFKDSEKQILTKFQGGEATNRSSLEISSDYQEFDFKNDIARAKNNVELESSERNIYSDNAELHLQKSGEANKHRLKAVDFSDNVVLIEKDKRVEAGDLFYLPEKKIIRIARLLRVINFSRIS